MLNPNRVNLLKKARGILDGFAIDFQHWRLSAILAPQCLSKEASEEGLTSSFASGQVNKWQAVSLLVSIYIDTQSPFN